MDDVIQCLKENDNILEENDFEKFINSDEFNDLEEGPRNEIFYMKAFDMSSKEYEKDKLKECINDFNMIIKTIKEFKENDDHYKIHECYEAIIKNYLNTFDDLFKPCFKEDQNGFTFAIHNLVDGLDNIIFPNNNFKNEIINELKNILGILKKLFKSINHENKLRFERYCNDFENFINEKEKNNIDDENNNNELDFNEYNKEERIKKEDNYIENINNKNENEFKENINLKNSINCLIFSENDENYNNNMNNNIDNSHDININNDSKNIINNEDFNNFNEYNNINIKNNLNNDINYNPTNINNINNENNNLINNNNQEYKISYNKSNNFENRNDLNDSNVYYDSMMDFSLSNIINEIAENEEEKEKEKEKVEEIYGEIENFVAKLCPMFVSKNINNEEEFKKLRKRYLKVEEINNNKINNNSFNININNIQNINNNISLNNSNNKKPNKKKKKGKKKKNNNSNMNINQSEN